MAANTTQSKLINKFKLKTKGAWKKSRQVDKEVKGGGLPDGIENGVAKVSSVSLIETKKKADPMFQFKMVVLEPEEYAGRSFMKGYVIAETESKTIQDKLDDLANDMKLMTDKDDEVEGLEEDDIIGWLEAQIEEGVYPTFRTWKGTPTKDFPNPQVNVTITGKAESAPDNADEVEAEGDPVPGDDETAAVEAEAEAEEAGEWKPAIGEIYVYKANAKAKGIDVEIISVDEKNQKVKAKQVHDKKVLPAVAWSQLAGE